MVILMDDTTETCATDATEENTQSDRAWWQWWLPLAMIPFFLGFPLLCHATLDRVPAGWTILIGLLLGAAMLGWADARQFRSTWSLPFIGAFIFFFSSALYYPDGSGYYAILIFGAILLGGKVGER